MQKGDWIIIRQSHILSTESLNTSQKQHIYPHEIFYNLPLKFKRKQKVYLTYLYVGRFHAPTLNPVLHGGERRDRWGRGKKPTTHPELSVQRSVFCYCNRPEGGGELIFWVTGCHKGLGGGWVHGRLTRKGRAFFKKSPISCFPKQAGKQQRWPILMMATQADIFRKRRRREETASQQKA